MALTASQTTGGDVTFMTVRQYVLDKLLDWLASHDKSKMLPMVTDFTWYRLTGIGERAETGKALYEPYGATRDFLGFSDLMLLPAQLADLPTSMDTPIDISVTLGPNAQRPLRIEMPVMVAGWGYGVSVKRNIRLAAAMAAEKAGIAVNSGEAGYLAEEKDLTSRYIVQYNRGGWGNSDEALGNAAMVEVWAGQGASAAMPTSMTADQIGPRLRQHLGVTERQGVSTDSSYPEVRSPRGWRGLVEGIRERCAGVPVAIKLAAGNIERDLEVAIGAGFDVIVLDGAQGGTAYSPELTINNFGLPTIYALPRAAAFLKKHGLSGKVSLVASGGLRDSGDVLKAIALGADAVYLSQAALAALLYTQMEKLPSDMSPASMFRYSPDEKEDIDADKGALSLFRFLQAVREEIDLGVRLLGKTALFDISPHDLISLTPLTAAATGVPLAVLNR